MIYNLSTFDCLTNEERKLYNDYSKCNKEDKKDELREKFEREIESFDSVRTVIKEKLFYKNNERRLDKVIAGFENECARLSESFIYDETNPKYIPFISEIIILDVYNETILSQIIDNGIVVDDKKYLFYSSSANQQKKKQVCLLEKEFWNKNYAKFMCGLTLDVINSNERVKGCNTGKYLAYTSLIFSKSIELPSDIRIDEVVILPEFETYVFAKVNYLDMENHTVGVRDMSVPVNHMDGAGMFLPGVFSSSAQIRGGWIKGCVFPFDFRQFIIEMQKQGKIEQGATTKDVWGNPISIDYIRDNVKLILNGSQLKMWKYYKSFEEYKQAFNDNGLNICINNTLEYPKTDEEPLTPSAYQFYQTIPRQNVTDEKIKNLCALTIEKINDARTNVNTALEIMGVDIDDDEIELDYMKACIKIYPKMLQDVHVRNCIKKNIESQRKKALSGKPLIRGFYNYICPDLYAACEYWFLGIENPKGLIPSNHVYNSFYNDKPDVKEVCCLRSPHLSDCEHGMRTLIKSDECKEWFHGLDTVISTHDLLTKTLQCDVDGDECLICHDKTFIDLVDRDKLPLYYEMRKAENTEVNEQNIKECLHRSFANSVIGQVSNAITKHLNLQDEPNTEFIRYMTAFNNFVIDHPKSQYMPKLPKEYEKMFLDLKSNDEKFPYFFHYAKEKDKNNCYDYNKDDEKSNVNRISKYIMDMTRNNKDNIWKGENKSEEESYYKPEMFRSDVLSVDRKSKEYESLYKLLGRLKKEDTTKNRRRIREKCKEYGDKSLGYDAFYHYCCSEIFKIIGIRKKAFAYLLDMEYWQRAYKDTTKEILWNCFGDIMYENLCENLKKPSDSIKIKRMAYQNRVDKEEVRGKLVEQIKEEINRDYEVPIYQDEYEWFTNLQCRKNSQYDKYVLFILLVEYKKNLLRLDKSEDEVSEDLKKHIKLHKNKRFGQQLTRAKIDYWIEHDVTDKGLGRLVDKGVITVKDVNCNKYKYYKIYLNSPFKIVLNRSVENPLFTVGAGNPMYYYYKYTGERMIKNCEVCGRLFAVGGNAKTCSDSCSEILRLLNKESA